MLRTPLYIAVAILSAFTTCAFAQGNEFKPVTRSRRPAERMLHNANVLPDLTTSLIGCRLQAKPLPEVYGGLCIHRVHCPITQQALVMPEPTTK